MLLGCAGSSGSFAASLNEVIPMFEKLMQSFERLVIVLVILVLLPCLLGAIVHAIGTLDLLLILGILSVAAYLRQGRRAPSAGGKRVISGAERSPLMPKGDQ